MELEWGVGSSLHLTGIAAIRKTSASNRIVGELENRHSLQNSTSTWVTVTTDLHPQHSIPFSVPLRHSALEGHFPGNPVVPGVVIIDQVITAAEAWLGVPLTVHGLPQVKFLRALSPGESAHLEIRAVGVRLEFLISRRGEVIAKGVLRRGMESTDE